ncbi:phosducin-like protein 3 [Blastocystis sp. ATCC 50177/Nand II]|uniref:Phosducin-like protein 3 n=1 Tax=Blastocystis sp. subtype 1 (strain ATCC 50177 / NandII) TaxID=478820 RepID=A0A196SM95_BLAHN|nr:phosducin-like protein 3 [Blastocystis sp. ATCC 50177/Nand II]
MSFFGGSTTYHKDPNETTEWEDILAERGIVPRKKDVEKALDEVLEERKEKVNPYEGRDLDELEDDLDEELMSDDDLAALNEYRQKRMAELQKAAVKNRFGYLITITRSEFVRQVTEASQDYPVVVFLYKDEIEDCRILKEILDKVSARQPMVKFVQMISTDCIKDYPDKNLPALFVYNKGSIVKQITTLRELGGRKVSVDIVEWVLQECGVVETDLEEDPRKTIRTNVLRL